MAKSQPRVLTEEYWRSFALSAEELDYLHHLILDAGIPQTAAFLAYDLVERRCEQEEAYAEEEAVEVLPYDPRQEHKVGQEIVVKIRRKREIVYLQGTVTGRRNVWQASYGHFEAIRVRFGEGKKATSKEYMASVKRGFDDWKPIPVEQVVGEDWDLGQTDEYIAPGEVFEQFQGYVLRQLTEQLGADARFIGFGHEWFVPELLAPISEDELAAAARRIEQAGDPLPLQRLTRVPEMPQQNEEFVRQFSWNHALSRDPRFDNVGTAGTPLWFLRALEPPEAVQKPPRLAIPALPPTREYQYVHRELKDMEQVIDDEGSEGEAPPLVTAGRVPSVEFVLSFAHRATGTIPLTSRIRRAFPQADGPRTWITFIDGRSGERMPGWVMNEDRYAWGLREWYDDNLIWAGACIRLETTENPLEMVVDYIPLPQSKEERVRVARVVDGQLTFEWQTRTIPYKYDPLMLIAETRFEDMEALWLEAEQVDKPIFEVLCDVFPVLARLHSQGHVHARTLYSAVNLVRRCAPGTVFGILSARPCFDSVGDGYWTYDPDLRDVKVVYRTEKEVEQRGKRGTWYDKAKRKAAARKAAETRRKREAELPPEERAGYKAARTRERRQQFWGMLGGLVGQELCTLHGHNPFTVDEVQERQVKIAVGTTGSPRTIQREEIELAWERLVEEESVSLVEIKRQFSDFNPTYVTAILAALPGATYRTKPIRLFYGQEAEPEAAPETLLAEEAPEVPEATSEGRPPATPTETAEPPTAEEVPVPESVPEQPAPPSPEPPVAPPPPPPPAISPTGKAPAPAPRIRSRRNEMQTKTLFSHHYLETRLPDHPEWTEDPRSAFEAVRALWQKARQYGENWNEAQTEEEFVKPVLEALGWAFIVQPKSGSKKGRVTRPDYALFESALAKDEAYPYLGDDDPFYTRALAIAEAKYWGRLLSQKDASGRNTWKVGSNPSHQMVSYLVGTRVPWGILTNGRTWRLYSREVSSTASEFYEVDLGLLFDSLPDDAEPSPAQLDQFRRWWLFFRRDAFRPDPQGKSFVQRIHEGSATYARQISEKLKELVFEQVVPEIAGGFVAYRYHQRDVRQETDESLREIYQATLGLLYKLLFLLYAEARSLLPVTNPGYREQSLTVMAQWAAERLDKALPLSDATHATPKYDALLALFRRVDQGDPSLGIPRYNGGLFNPASPENRFLEEHKLSDRAVARAVDILVRDADQPVDYAYISVRNLGAIYEGLLENKLQVVDAADGQVELVNDKGERKASGSYYTPDYIVEYIVQHTLDPILDERQARFQAAMDRCADLRRKLQRTSDTTTVRRLRAQLDEAERDAREAFLGIKVCDPAMGSGHFLVNAVDHLTDGIIQRMQAHHDDHPDVPWEWNPIQRLIERVRGEILAEMDRQGITVDPDRLDDTALLARLVMKRCIYGVDLNPLAVELAKLSLWLHSFTVGAPLSFLDHHLRWGNSLIGSDVRAVEEAVRMTETGQVEQLGTVSQFGLFAGPFAGLLDLTALMIEVAEQADATLADVQRSAEVFEQFQRELTPYKQVLDLWVSQYFGNDVAREFLTLYGGDVLPTLRGKREVDDKYQAAIDQARVLWRQKRFFHWDLEFPEVFVDLRKRDWAENPGFDVVVGNPPYDELSKDALGREIDEKSYLTKSDLYKEAVTYRINLYRLFIALALNITRPGGRQSFIVPMSLLGDRFTRDLRRKLLTESDFQLIEAFPQKDDPRNRVFTEAKLPTCLYVLKDQLPQSTFRVRTHSGREIAKGSPAYVATAAQVAEFDPDNLSIPTVDEPSWRLALRLRESPGLQLFKEVASSSPGEIMINKEFRRFLSDEPPGEIILRGAHIGRYELYERPKQGLPVYLDKEKFLKSRGKSKDSKAYDHLKARIGYQRGSAIDNWRRIIATAIEPGFFCSDTVAYLVEANYDLHALLAFLNSQVCEWRFRLTSTTNHVNSYEIDMIPIRRIAFTTPPDERMQLVGVGITEATEFIEHTEGAASVSFSAFSASVFGRWLDERLSPTHTPDPALVRQHNADPLNRDHQLPEAGPVEQSDVVHDLLAHLAAQMMAMNKDKQAEVEGFLSWLETFLGCPVDDLSGKTYVRAYDERTFDKLVATLKKNRRRIQLDLDRRDPLEALRAEWETSMGKLRPLLVRLAATDRLIDLIVYRLYGLTEEEVAVVEGAR